MNSKRYRGSESESNNYMQNENERFIHKINEFFRDLSCFLFLTQVHHSRRRNYEITLVSAVLFQILILVVARDLLMRLAELETMHYIPIC